MKYLCYYAQEFAAFRVQELEAIARTHGIHILIERELYDENKPFLLIDAANDDIVKKIISRSVLLKCICELWSEGKTIEAASHPNSYIKEKLDETFSAEDPSFKFEVEVFDKKLSMEDRVAYIEEIQKFIPAIPGDVNLKTPDIVLSLLLSFTRESKDLDHVYFGRLVGTSQRHAINQYKLRTRYFIGNTSMDPQLAMVMANQAQVTRGDFCYDPFVGTGSILVGCAHFGGVCAGNDIDWNVVFGRGKTSRVGEKTFKEQDELVRTNFERYGLSSQYLDILAADGTRLPVRVTEIFDAIITDPPYGIREGGRKLGSKKETTWIISEDERAEHIPAKRSHAISDIISDLLEFAVKYLVVGGRLVYWFPVYRPTYTPDALPRHTALELLSNSEQVLSKKLSRRLITMRKCMSLQQFLDSPTEVQSSDIWRQQQESFRRNLYPNNY